MIMACVPKISPLKYDEKDKKFKVTKKHFEETEKWLVQIAQSLLNYVDLNKDLLDDLVLYVVYWIDVQRRQNNKGFNSNILFASNIARWNLLKDKYSNK
jgi:hypothetical protein